MSAGALRAALPRALRRVGSALPPRIDLLAALVVAALLEAFGRVSTSDWLDVVGALALGEAGLLFATRWKLGQRFGQALLGRLAHAGRGLRPVHGLDLRREPALPCAVPRAALLGLVLTLLLLGLALLARAHVPGSMREALRGLSGLLSLAATGLLWAALGLLGVGLWNTLFEGLRRRLAPVRSQLTGLALLGAVGLASWRMPPSWGLTLVVLAWALPTATVLVVSFDVRLAWRPASGGALRGGRLGWWEAGLLTGITALALIPIVLAVGDRLTGPGSDSTGGTALVGRFVLWTLGLELLAFGWNLVPPLIAARLADPARRRPARVVLGGTGERRAARRLLERAGYRCHERAPRGAVAVRLWLGPPPGPVPAEGSWSGVVTLQDLERPGFLERLARRQRIQSRRALTKGLTRILPRLRGARAEGGSGTWIAPHLWIATHPSRDGEGPGSGPRGRPWRRLLPQAARQALAEVLEALDIDLVFIEDGVRPRAFRRVLELLFEHHDLFGRRRCEDTRHFAGLPGVRVVIHEVGLDVAPQRATPGYPEPDYEDIGRARILHVFRDRGGEREPVSAPQGRDRRPSMPQLSPRQA